MNEMYIFIFKVIALILTVVLAMMPFIDIYKKVYKEVKEYENKV